MDLLEAIILGIVQGLTEFLPVSSSGHLELAKLIFSSIEKPPESMNVVLHFATALSTCIIFRKDIAKIFGGLFQFKNNEETQFSLKIVLSMIPAAIVGFLYDDILESYFTGKAGYIGFFLLVTGVLLFIADKAKTTKKDISIINSIIIGVSQAVALLPGISRSGATISTSVILGVDRERAARFSFLMVIPLIFGKIAKDIISIWTSQEVHEIQCRGGIDIGILKQQENVFLVVGFLFAFITGLIACKLMIRLVKNAKLYYFSLYCFAVGITAIIYSFIS